MLMVAMDALDNVLVAQRALVVVPHVIQDAIQHAVLDVKVHALADVVIIVPAVRVQQLIRNPMIQDLEHLLVVVVAHHLPQLIQFLHHA